MFSPHVAEDMWSLLGHEPFIGVQQFPQADPSLVVDSTVTAVVQINGKVKERLDVAPDISESDLSARAPRLTLREATAPQKLQSQLIKQRRAYQHGLLAWLRGERALAILRQHGYETPP